MNCIPAFSIFKKFFRIYYSLKLMLQFEVEISKAEKVTQPQVHLIKIEFNCNTDSKKLRVKKRQVIFPIVVGRCNQNPVK